MYISSFVNSPTSIYTRVHSSFPLPIIPSGPPTEAEKFLQSALRIGENIVHLGLERTVGQVNPFVSDWLAQKFREKADKFIDEDLIRIHRQLKPFQRSGEWGPQKWFNQLVDYLVDTPIPEDVLNTNET